MKKWMALVLTLVLALTCLGNAVAETAYENMRDLLMKEDNLGEPSFTMATDQGRMLLMMSDLSDNQFSIYGYNAKGQGEMTIWQNVDAGTNFIWLYASCAAWDDVSAALDSGFTMAIGFRAEADDEWTTIEDQSMAQLLADTLLSSFE